MSQTLTTEHYSILLSLINNPTITSNALTKKLHENGLNISYHIINKRISELHEWGILRKSTMIKDPIVLGNVRYISDAEANYKPSALGMKRQHVIYYDIKDVKRTHQFGKACDIHPYTHYRSLGISNGIAGYAEFDIPLAGMEDMNQYYRSLGKILRAKSFELINAERVSASELDLYRWSPKTQKWNFSVNDEDEKHSLQYYWKHHKSDQTEFISSYREPVLKELDELDLQLIRELNINAKVRASELAQIYNKDASTISRRLKKIQEKVLDRSTLFYDRYKFDVSIAQILVGKAPDAATIDTFHKMLEQKFFPFRSTLISDKSKFLWVMNTPPVFAPEISYFVWSKVDEFKSITLSLLNNKSWRYPLYPNNFNSSTRSWNVERAYLVDNPLEAI